MAGSDRRVVITGYGAMTPLGEDVASTFDAAREGRSGIDVVRRFDPEKLPCRIAGEIDDEWLASQENGGGRRLDKFSTRGVRMMRVAVSQAARAARLGEISERRRVGVALGSHGDHPQVEELLRIFPYWKPMDSDPLQGGWDIKELKNRGVYDLMTFFRRKSDVATSVVALDFDCRGPTVSICSACAAGAQAIGESVRLIRDAKADVMVAGWLRVGHHLRRVSRVRPAHRARGEIRNPPKRVSSLRQEAKRLRDVRRRGAR